MYKICRTKYLGHGLDLLLEVLSGHAELLHDDVAGSGEAIPVNTDNLASVLVPKSSDASLHSNALSAGRGKDGLLVLVGLTLIGLHAGHGNDAGTGHVLGGLESVLDLGTSGNDNNIKVALLLLGNVSTLEGTLTTLGGGEGVVLLEVLTGEDKDGGTFLASDGRDVSGNGLLGISGTVNVNIGEGAEAGDGLNRLMGGSILTYTDGVMGEDVRDAAELGEAGNTDGGAEVVGEDKEGGAGGPEESVVGEAVEDGAHGVLADTEVEVLSGVGLVEAGAVVAAVVDVVAARAVEIGRSRDVLGNELGDLLNDLVAGDTGGLGVLLVHVGDLLDHVLGRHDVVGDGILELLGKVGVGLGPGLVGGLPLVVARLVLLLDALEEVAGALGDVPLLALGKADVDLGLVNVGDAGLTVSGVGALGLLHTLTDDGVALDELGLAIVGGLGGGDGGLNGIEVMAIDVIGLPSVSIVTLDDVLGLSVLGHLVEGDLVGVVEDDEVVELLVGGEGGGLGGDTLLEAAITGEGVDVVVEDLVVVGVVDSLSHLLGGGDTDGVGDALSEGTGGGLNAGGVVLGVGELGVAGSHGVVLTEVLELIDGEVEAGKVEPGVKEHGSVAGGKDEAITVDPGGVRGVVGHLGAVEGGTDLGGTEGKAHVAGVGGGDGVHGQTTGLVGGGGEGGLGVNIDGSAHLDGGGGGLHGHDAGRGVGHGGEAVNTGEGRGGNSEHGELHGYKLLVCTTKRLAPGS
mmetsp:Transcript_10183/g.28581  ORF Transcript_10183/g.28581 Transcript_10183/m.28581 type:complete len:741 (+) Transcript_10183:131-2353(+)